MNLQNKASEYLVENKEEFILCEDFINNIPNIFNWKKRLQLELLGNFIRRNLGMMVNWYLISKGESFKSSNFDIEIRHGECNGEIRYQIIYKSDQHKFQHLSTDHTVFLKMNLIDSCLQFHGFSPLGNLQIGLSFNSFGVPLHKYFAKMHEVPLEDAQILYLIKHITIKAMLLLRNNIFLDFLHPGNIFITKDNEIVIFPNSFALAAFTEELKFDTGVFKAPDALDIRANPEGFIVYSLGILALYLKGFKAIAPLLHGEISQGLKLFAQQNREFLSEFLLHYSERINLLTVAEILE